MKRAEILVSDKFLPEVRGPWLHCFLSRRIRVIGRRYRKAVIICPSGSYRKLAEPEMDMVALRFQAYGYQAFVMHYSVGGVPYPTALMELAEAVALVREHMDDWDISPEGIFLCGFSAGGHLSASLATHWNKPLLENHYPNGGCRPNGTILCYPIITAQLPYRAPIFMEELQVDEGSPYFSWLSVEKHVGEDTPPAFIWHNADDTDVSVMNSILYMSALSKHHVPFETHIFPWGGHGLSLADETTASAENYIGATCAAWVSLAMDWLRRT